MGEGAAAVGAGRLTGGGVRTGDVAGVGRQDAVVEILRFAQDVFIGRLPIKGTPKMPRAKSALGAETPI